jgi:hypothetical protein
MVRRENQFYYNVICLTICQTSQTPQKNQIKSIGNQSPINLQSIINQSIINQSYAQSSDNNTSVLLPIQLPA